jgi:hypothetical protein
MFSRGWQGLNAEQLFNAFIGLGRQGWIWGREAWEKYDGVEDLERVVVGGEKR